MHRLAQLGLRHLAHRRGRSALAALGICLGVAVLFGTELTGATVGAGVRSVIAGVTGAAQVEVSPVGSYDAVLSEKVVPTVARLPGVVAASPSLGLSGPARHAGRTDAGLQIEGETPAATSIYRFRYLSGTPPAPGQVALAATAAHHLEAGPGATVRMVVPAGTVSLRVSGIVAATGAGQLAGGDVGFTTLATAQRLDAAPGGVDQVAVLLGPHVPPAAWLAAHGGAVPRADMAATSTADPAFRSFLGVVSGTLDTFAALSLLLAAFLIYLTLGSMVVERTRTYGTLRALGATRAQLRRVVLVEAGVMGAAGTAAGLVVGFGVGAGLTSLLARLVHITPPGMDVTATAVGVAVGVGVVTSVASGLLPALRAARMSPVSAMRGGVEASLSLSPSWVVGVVIAAGGLVVTLVSHRLVLASTGMLAVLLGAMLALPALLAPLARPLGRVTARLSRGAGHAAVAHLVRERSRSAYTAAVLMVVLTQALVIGAAGTSMSAALDQVLNRQFGADIQVANLSGSLAPATLQTVLSTPGVGPSTVVSYGSTHLVTSGGGKQRVPMEFVDPATFFAVQGFAWSAGTDTGARRALVAGRGLLVPGPFATAHHLGVGSVVSLDTTKGAEPFTVAGVYRSFATGSALATSAADGRALFAASRPDTLALDARPGVRPDQLRLVLDRRLGLPPTTADVLSRRGLSVATAGELKTGASSQMHGFFTLFEAVLGVALLVSLLGLANTLVMSVIARYREIGVLRAVGSRRAQIRAMVVVESLTLAAVAVAVAVTLGVPLSADLVRAVAVSLGYQIPYQLPWATLVVVAGLGAAVAGLAALAPARRAARLDVVEALRYD